MTNQDWMTIREASLALGVSELTVRRRIKAGRLASRIENGKYFVNFSAAAAPRVPPAPATAPDPVERAPRPREMPATQRAAPPLEAILPEYGRLAEQAGRAAVLADQVRRLEEEQRGMRESLVALAGRNGWLESRLEEREQALKMLADSRPKPRWWRRLLGRT